MITNKDNFRLFPQDNFQFFLPEDVSPEEILFFDIETTGLSHRSSRVCLIGGACFCQGEWLLTQFLAESESPQEELEVLKAFASLCLEKKYILHYNGSTFDIPYLGHRFREHRLFSPLEKMVSVDLYRTFSPLRPYLKIPDFKQRTLEKLSGFQRSDTLSGKEWIQAYKTYAKTKDSRTLDLILGHNRDDLEGLARLLGLGPLKAMLQGDFSVLSPEVITERDMDGSLYESVLFTLKLPGVLPKPLSLSLPYCYMTFQKDLAKVKIPLLEGTLKYFYPDYKNYYYLPLEDEAVHKSVGKYVDASCREQAKASNCHKRVSGYFLMSYGSPPMDCFYESYGSQTACIQWTEDLMANSALQKAYLAEYLKHFISIH